MMRRLPVLLPLLALAGCTSLYFQPTRREYVRPEELKLRYDAVRFASRDGTGLAGLFLYASTAPVRGTVIQFHGNGENMTSHYLNAVWLTAQGYNVFAFDYRGYGASEGLPVLKGVVEDGIAAIDYVAGRKDVEPGRVAVWGQSLGGAVAVAAAALRERPGVRVLILESTFGSYRDMAQDVLSRSWATWAFQRPLSRLLISDGEAPNKYLGRLPPCPVLVIHSADDPIVPFWLGEKLYQELREPKEFWKVEHARHLEVFARADWPYRRRLVEFLDRELSVR